MNWHFAFVVAASCGGLAGLAIWMCTASLPHRAEERTGSNSEQQ